MWAKKILMNFRSGNTTPQSTTFLFFVCDIVEKEGLFSNISLFNCRLSLKGPWDPLLILQILKKKIYSIMLRTVSKVIVFFCFLCHWSYLLLFAIMIIDCDGQLLIGIKKAHKFMILFQRYTVKKCWQLHNFF